MLVDIVHLHRGYVSDCTRMFCSGKLDEEWTLRLDDMAEISDLLRRSLGRGDNCSEAGKSAWMLPRKWAGMRI